VDDVEVPTLFARDLRKNRFGWWNVEFRRRKCLSQTHNILAAQKDNEINIM
jgi:hypothetical protein